MNNKSLNKSQLPDLLLRLKEAVARFEELRGFL
jgi:hypothetical protein